MVDSRSGKGLQAIKRKLSLTDADVMNEARVSMSSLSKVYRDKKVHPHTKSRVMEAFDRLRAKHKASA